MVIHCWWTMKCDLPFAQCSKINHYDKPVHVVYVTNSKPMCTRLVLLSKVPLRFSEFSCRPTWQPVRKRVLAPWPRNPMVVNWLNILSLCAIGAAEMGMGKWELVKP